MESKKHKRFVTTCVAKGGVGKTTGLFHLLRWYSLQDDGALRVSAFDPDGENKSLYYLTGAQGDYSSPYQATVVDPANQEGMFAVTSCFRDGADISALDGVGANQKKTIDKGWFDYLDVPAICDIYNARVTMILVVDNTALVYKECLIAIKKYASVQNVDFVIYHIRRDSRDSLDDSTNKNLFNTFIEGHNGSGGVKQLLPDWERRFAWAEMPYVSTKLADRMHAAQGTIFDLYSNEFIDSPEHQALLKRVWDGYCSAFKKTAHLILPKKEV